MGPVPRVHQRRLLGNAGEKAAAELLSKALKAAAAEYRALAEWRGRIRFAVVGLTGDPASGFTAELVEDPFE